jgi:hypothetical protein
MLRMNMSLPKSSRMKQFQVNAMLWMNVRLPKSVRMKQFQLCLTPSPLAHRETSRDICLRHLSLQLSLQNGNSSNPRLMDCQGVSSGTRQSQKKHRPVEGIDPKVLLSEARGFGKTLEPLDALSGRMLMAMPKIYQAPADGMPQLTQEPRVAPSNELLPLAQ